MARRPTGVRLTGPVDAAANLAELAALSKPEIVDRFRAVYGCPPPKRMRREVLVRAVAHRIQEQAQGGLDPALRRRLAKLAEELHRTGSISVAAPPAVKPGTRLLREWNGETHSVTVASNGFMYKGEVFRSLSKIARVITGTRWSGPAFFGLRRAATIDETPTRSAPLQHREAAVGDHP